VCCCVLLCAAVCCCVLLGSEESRVGAGAGCPSHTLHCRVLVRGCTHMAVWWQDHELRALRAAVCCRTLRRQMPGLVSRRLGRSC
jgi:hypothetical protein